MVFLCLKLCTLGKGVYKMQKIMLIEDDISIFNLIKDKFLHWSFEVIGPNNFQQVLPTFLEEKPQLVLIDIQLPAYDGFHWCREIRRHSKVPIILFLEGSSNGYDYGDANGGR